VKDITKNHNGCPKNLDINGKVIPSWIGHKGTQASKKKWGSSIRRDVELNSPLRHYICSSMYHNYVSYNGITLIKMVYMCMKI
jgi:hypothetical protein